MSEISLINIRKCMKEDLNNIADLLNQLKEASHSENEFTMEQIKVIFSELEKLPDLYLNLVAENDGIIVGFISAVFYKTLFHKGGTALINELVVRHGYQGKGIGGRLVEAVKMEALARGMDELEVGTETTNLPALSFYRKFGFDEEYVLLGMEF